MNKHTYYYFYKPQESTFKRFVTKLTRSVGFLGMTSLVLILSLTMLAFYKPVAEVLSPISQMLSPIQKAEAKQEFEVFGFAPFWTINQLDNVNFDVLTTLAYFDVGINADGSLDREGPGYTTFHSEKATALFEKAQDHGTKVVLTLTMMDTLAIESFLDDPQAQDKAIEESVALVKDRGIDGINVDVEYFGSANGVENQRKFTKFVEKITAHMHSEVEGSYVTVSVYASAVKEPRIYDVQGISEVSDGIFMMAYDFATVGSDEVIPTAPLYGHKEGEYWYDISTAVEDFLTKMPEEKLILGLPWYGYDYPVESPGVKVPRHGGYYATAYSYWGYPYSYYVYPSAHAQTYGDAKNDIKPTGTGWDDLGKVGWISYIDGNGVTRQLFLDDPKSLAIKYDFAKEKDLGGVGMWALGFDDGKTDMWAVLESKFGNKTLADSILKVRQTRS